MCTAFSGVLLYKCHKLEVRLARAEGFATVASYQRDHWYDFGELRWTAHAQQTSTLTSNAPDFFPGAHHHNTTSSLTYSRLWSVGYWALCFIVILSFWLAVGVKNAVSWSLSPATIPKKHCRPASPEPYKADQSWIKKSDEQPCNQQTFVPGPPPGLTLPAERRGKRNPEIGNLFDHLFEPGECGSPSADLNDSDECCYQEAFNLFD